MEFTKVQSDRIQFWVLNSASFIANLTVSMISLSLVYHLRRVFGLSASSIGVAVSLSTFSYFVGCVGLAKVVQALKPRYCVALSLLGMSLSLLSLVLAQSLFIVYASLCFYGLFMSLLWPPIEAWFSRGKEGRQLNRATNSFNFAWSFGSGLSTYVAGLLVEKSTYLPFYVGIGSFAFVCAFVTIIANLVPQIRAVSSEESNIKESKVKDQSTPLRFYCWVGVVLVYTGMSVIQTIFPLYAMDVLTISEVTIGALLMVRGVATCLMFLVLSQTDFWQFKKSVILLVQLGFALLCFWGMTIHSLVLFALFFFCFGIIFAFSYCLSMFHGVSGCVNKAKRMTIHEVLLTIGQIIGAVLGGVIYERFSFSRILLLIGTVTFVVLLVETLAGSRTN